MSKSKTIYQTIQEERTPEDVEINHWIKKSLSQYPENHKKQILGDLNSKDGFLNAFFELIVYYFLCKLGCVIVHPDYPSKRGKVDFEVRNDKEQFFVEATVCKDSKSNLNPNNGEQDFLQRITKSLSGLDFNIHIENVEGKLNDSTKEKDIIKKIKQIIIKKCCKPGYIWIEKDDWKLTLSVEPKISKNKKNTVIEPVRKWVGEGSQPIQKSLMKKAKKWGMKNKESIFIIALNICHPEYCSPIGEMRAIYEIHDRDPINGKDGFSKYLSHVAGIIVFDRAFKERYKVSPVRFYQNPMYRTPTCLEFLKEKEVNLASLIGS
ncbi:MAG: hypothetical protein OXC61_06040 [Flavobacteriaceae bacterium]|nr:hypothetical protein [Flavobacteriaceae bacterium]